MRSCLLLVFLLLCLSAPSALAAEPSAWSATFPAEALATWLDSPPARYLLVPAGAVAPELGEAEQALAAALRGSGKATLVMNAQALGAVASLDDAAIVQRGAGFPVDRILVLRLFPDASGALTQAVVTVYDPTGTSRGAFSASRGMALAPKPSPSEPPVAAAPAPRKSTPEGSAPATPARPRAPGQDPVAEYAQRYIGFEEFVTVSGNTGSLLSRHNLPYEGKFKRPLEGDAFYKKLGREDLVQAYSGKMNLKIGLAIAGGALGVGGFVYSVSSLASRESCANSANFSACIDRNLARAHQQQQAAAVGLGAAMAGIGLVSATFFINPHPISPSEARELAEGYNQKLKSELGLSEDGKPIAPPERPASLQARLTPVLDAKGGGLVLHGTF